jgi:tetratricopeptide (TPR) repeat protein
MPAPTPSSGDRTVFELITRARAERFTGVVELEVREQKRALAFVDGELHLPAGHPHAARWRELLAEPAASGAAAAMATLLEQLADSLAGTARSVARTPGQARLPPERVGPLPTAKLLRVTAGRDPKARAGIVRRFGDRPLVAQPLSSAGSWVWSPEELWVLERLRQPTTLAELARNCPMPREVLERAVAGLASGGQLRVEGAAPATTDDDDLNELTAGLGERIEAALTESPLEIEGDDFRHRVAALLANSGGLDHYELLGVDPDTPLDDTQRAYEELARLVHPVNARRFQAPELAEPLRFLFERATEAYHTLTDPDLRLAYRNQLGLAPPATRELSPEERARELKEMARRNFDRARAEEANGDYHSALVLLESVVGMDPTSEHHCALGKLLARNPAWTSRAIESYRAALALDPKSCAIRFALGELYERVGDRARALELYEAAAQGAAPHAGARAALERLRAERAQGEKGSGPRRLASIFRRS